jgi:hypothetical protein
MSTEGHCEDERASFTDSSRSVDVQEEFRPTQAVVGELETELVTLHRCNGITESGGHASWDLSRCADKNMHFVGNESKTQATMVDAAVEFPRYIWFMNQFYAILLRGSFPCRDQTLGSPVSCESVTCHPWYR